MTQITLTEETIREDMKAYQDRLDKVQDKLDDLPVRGSSWKDTRKIKVTRHRLEAEVVHVQGLIRLASAALTEPGQAGESIIK